MFIRNGVVDMFRVVTRATLSSNIIKTTIHRFYTCGKLTGQYSPDRLKKNARLVTKGVKIFIENGQWKIRQERFM